MTNKLRGKKKTTMKKKINKNAPKEIRNKHEALSEDADTGYECYDR